MVDKSIYNKKIWLLNHASLIQSLKLDGMTNKQIIDHLKTDQNMPFELDESLFSRHCKTILQQLDLKKINADLINKTQSLEKYNLYLENSNKYLLLQNRELSKPKTPEPLPDIPINYQYITDLENRVALKQQSLEQNKNTIEELEGKLKKLSHKIENDPLKQENIALKLDVRRLETLVTDSAATSLEQNQFALLQKENTIGELQGKLVQLSKNTKNDHLKTENIGLKRDVRRLESLLTDSSYATSLASEKLNTAQMRAKQSMYLAYCFLAISIILLLVIVI